ncbi:30S ribosomal protein S8e [Candidatus Aenigmatarchaeota archaeon]
MAKWYMKSRKKKTGGLLKRSKKKKKYQRGRDFLPAIVGEKKTKVQKTRGGSTKRISMYTNTANITIDGKSKKAKILSVTDNKADSHYIRRNIMTKGAIIETELGQARVTSRPGQEGNVNAVLIKKK